MLVILLGWVFQRHASDLGFWEALLVNLCVEDMACVRPALDSLVDYGTRAARIVLVNV